MMTDGRLASIHIHPVKSCRRVEVDQAIVSGLGLAGDRMWQLVDERGHPLNQRQHRALASVQPEIVGDGLRLSAPGRDPIDVAPPGAPDGEVRSLFGVSVPCSDAGDAVAGWFGSLVGERCRLAAISDGPGWRLPDGFELHQQPMAFADAAPVLVTTASSLEWLQARAVEPFGMERFRPNLVIENDEPWVEDTWAELTIGEASLTASLAWPRCAIPQIDQDTVNTTDVPRHREPARVLKEHRWCTDATGLSEAVRPIVEGSSLFGIGCTIGPSDAVVRVGDPVTVRATAPPLLDPPLNG